MPIPSENDRYVLAARLKGYLDKHDEAVELLTEALERDPDNPILRRYRAHRRISIRDFHGAIEDSRHALAHLETVEDGYELYQHEVEKDIVNLVLGRDELVREQFLPKSEARGRETIYSTTFYSAVYYHFGVALYLNGELQEAAENFERAFEVSEHAEALVASLDWLYMIHRRLGDEKEAHAVLARFAQLSEVDESDPGYTERMRLYAGERTPEDLIGVSDSRELVNVTQLYGVGNWLHYNGRPAEAKAVFERVLDSEAKFAFAYMAAEAELSDSALARI
ncbi:hypothetical protein GCM10020360_14960 [Nonlabens tegetincola]